MGARDDRRGRARRAVGNLLPAEGFEEYVGAVEYMEQHEIVINEDALGQSPRALVNDFAWDIRFCVGGWLSFCCTKGGLHLKRSRHVVDDRDEISP